MGQVVSELPELEWTPIQNADHYTLVLSVPGLVPFYVETDATSIDLGALAGASAEIIIDGEFTWQVFASDEYHTVIANSPVQTFLKDTHQKN